MKDRIKAYPPCPDRFAPPPGHTKVDGPKERPCRPGKGGSGGMEGGLVVVAPLAVAAWGARRLAGISNRSVRRPRRR